MTTLSLKQHDTVPALTITCTDNGEPVDLTAATTVKVIGSIEGLVLFSDTTTGTDAGVVTRAWEASDTNTPGTILVEVEVTWPGGGVQTFPADGYLTVEVIPDIGGLASPPPGSVYQTLTENPPGSGLYLIGT